MEPKCIIHFLPAKAGDCFLLENERKACILIDCGYRSTYQNELKPLLERLAKDGCRISLMIITHIDEDHLEGAIAFLEDNRYSDDPQIIPIDNIWFNGVLTVCSQSEKILSHVKDKLESSEEAKYNEVFGQVLKQLKGESGPISARESESFEVLCKKYKYSINQGFDCGLVERGIEQSFQGFRVKVLSPDRLLLEHFESYIHSELVCCFGRNYSLIQENKFYGFLEKLLIVLGKDEKGASREQYICSSIPNIDDWIGTSTMAAMNTVNRVSIVVEIEYAGYKMLFMGDSESQDWISNASKHYNLVKLSHHGTTKPNIALLSNIKCDKVLISTNGSRNNHPEEELLANVIMAGIPKIFFNYDIDKKDDIMLLQERYNYKAFFSSREIMLG